MSFYFLDNFKLLSNLNKIALISSNNEKISWKDYYQNAIKFSNSLNKINIHPEESVAILGYNSPEWFYSAIGSMMISKYVGIYLTNSSEEIEHIFNTCNVSVLVIENYELLKNIKLKNELRIIIMWGEPIKNNYYKTIQLINFYDFLELSDEYFIPKNREKNDVLTYFTTSGTTGLSKIVEHTYKSLSYSIFNIWSAYGLDEKRIVSYLPLSHVGANFSDFLYHFYHFGQIYFSKNDGKIIDMLRIVKPTLFWAVPRIWEKINIELELIISKFNIIKKQIYNFISKQNLKYHNNYWQKNSENINFFTKIFYLISNLLIMNQIKKNIGLDKCKIAISGSAPISKIILDNFAKINIIILESYGMTETGIFTINTNENKRKFSVGKNYYGQIKIVSDGEILYKNKSCLKQYKNNKKATNELIDEENWIHTGDIGKLDEDGYLYITGRKKELIITSGGENVPPVLIENRIRTFIKGISNIMVVGDKRKYLSCIVTLPKIEYNNPEKLEKWNSLIKQEIDNYNSIAISRVQTIKKFKILESEFSIENGCLTPTMKLKRNFIIEKFKKEIDEMYDD